MEKYNNRDSEKKSVEESQEIAERKGEVIIPIYI